MNIKKIFGAMLTALGISGFIYTTLFFADASGVTRDIKVIIIFGLLCITFFVSGIGLVRTAKGES
jgi:hypothetical protein